MPRYLQPLNRLWLVVMYCSLSVALVLLNGCVQRDSFPKESESLGEEIEEGVAADTVVEKKYDGRLLAQVVFDSVDYIVSRQDLLQPFIREFGDGTVVDKVMIRKVHDNKKESPAYYLVGLGMRNGAFRSMALELEVASDNSLYLSSKGAKHMCQAAVGCDFCYFTFSGNRITGCECSSRAPGSNCIHKFSNQNELLKGVQLRNTRKN